MERFLTKSDFVHFKKMKIYKLLDVFLTDEEKGTVIENLAIGAFSILSKIKWFSEEILSGDKLITISTDKHLFIMVKGKNEPNYVTLDQKILYKKRSFLSPWDELQFPDHLFKMIQQVKNKKEARKVLNGIMKMKAFW